MFTGLVQTLGQVEQAGGARLVLSSRLKSIRPGDSVAVNGVCLTATGVRGPGSGVSRKLAFDVGPETFRRTALGRLQAGDAVNLETALTPATPLGGHLVTGHVDAVARLARKSPPDLQGFVTVRISLPRPLARFVAVKGSVAVDGVSLTVTGVGPGWFEVMLIPHTLLKTTLGLKGRGEAVNLEVDLVARYVQRALEAR